MTISFEKTIIDDEVISRVRYILNSLRTEEEAFSMDIIKEVGHGGSYLMHMSTMKNVRAGYQPAISDWNNYDGWMKAFADCGIDPAFYANRQRGENELLPWDFIDAGVTRAFLWREWQRALRAEVTPDCRKGCQGCGLKRFEGVCVDR